MGFRLGILISSDVSDEDRDVLLRSAQARWPFARAPVDEEALESRLVLAPPELTDYLFSNPARYELAIEQHEEMRGDLVAWSREHPETTFAFIETESAPGGRRYSGFTCRAGFVTCEELLSRRGHLPLLEELGISAKGYFKPFSRGFFSTRALGPPV